MKKRIVLILITFIVNLGYSQTKLQTLEWLNSKLYEYGDTTMGVFSFSTEFFEGEEVIGVKQESYYLGTTIYVIFPISVNDVTTTKSCRVDGKRCVVIKAKDNYIMSATKGGVPTFDNELMLLLYAAPDEEVFKIQKSIKHLLKLMGNNIPDTKDLF